MGNIVLLDDLTINKIAAGEVIERPASVIKEMVENSIDAGATNIVVEIKNGGISYMKVSDNGKGIPKDDLELAFERHATSKIRKAEDLNTVTSMGFRGEALASIASIAHVELISKTKEQDFGYKVTVEGGNILDKQEIGASCGTSITVQNLFYNTPVRYKFLKKDYTETGYIEDVITRIALVHPEISIKLINMGKTVIQTTGDGILKNVIYSIYGKEIAQGVIDVSYIYEDIVISGAIGKPEIARSNRSNQMFFVNKRYVKDKTLSAATEQAYKGMIPLGKFGFVILNIQISPSAVDVNVHPAKLEVRFQEENKIFQAIYHSIKDTLLKGDLVSNTKVDKNTQIEKEEETKEQIIVENSNHGGLFNWRKPDKKIEEYTEEESKIKTNIIEQVYLDKQKKNMQTDLKNEENIKPQTDNEINKIEEPKKISTPLDTSDILLQLKELKENLQKEVNNNNEEKTLKENIEIEPQEEKYKVQQDEIITKEVSSPIETNIKEQEETRSEENNKTIDNSEIYNEKLDFNKMYEKTFGKLPIDENKKEQDKKMDMSELLQNNLSVFENMEEYKIPTYHFIGIAFNTYIIIEMNKELYIIDQHAAHERIMYEKVKKNYYSEEIKNSQMLLLPDIITLTHKEMDIAKENIPMFEKAGFCLEEFGENTIKLTGVPTVCIDLDTKELFLETLDEINTVARTAKQEKEEKFIATVACKAAVKANMALTAEEVDSLMQELLQLPNPFTCPHGRPTAIKMTKYDIERKFARK